MDTISVVSVREGSRFRTIEFLFFMIACVTIYLMSGSNSYGGEKTIVQDVIQAYGGKDALSRITCLSEKGAITAYMRGGKGTYSVVMKRGRKLLVEIAYTNMTEKRILNGDRGYRGSEAQVTEVQGAPYDAMVYQYNQLDLPYGLADGTLTAKYLRKGMVRGRTVDVLEVVDGKGNKMEMSVDKETHRILKTSASFGHGAQSAVLSAEFGDFKKVDGVLLPFEIANYAGEFKISDTRISSYTLNKDIRDSVFAP
jgi:outer membrane lipoprotein-sorting protein